MNNKNKPDFSLVLACYNESEHIEESIKKIIETLDDTRYKYELILIDDKSKDNTANVIKKIKKQHKSVRAYFHKKNIGRGGTVKEGILKAKAEVVGFIDVDLEVAPDYIPKFVRTIKNNEAEIAIGHRYYPSHLNPGYFLRTILSRGYISLVKILLGLDVKDSEAGYKFFDKNKVLPALVKTKNNQWFWDTEIVARSLFEGLRLKQMPVLFLRRSDKTSTVRLIPDIIDYFKAIYKFKKELKKELGLPPGLIYSFPGLYTLAMKKLFGNNYESRYLTVSKFIKPNSSVVDICCGDTVLYNYLENKKVDYLGVDLSPAFVLYGLKRGLRMKLADVSNSTIPTGDYIVLQGSLYQFKNPGQIINKLYHAAQKSLIISESIEKFEDNPIIDKTFLKSVLPAIVGTRRKNPHFRFNEKTFKRTLQKYSPHYVKTKGGRDIVAVIMKSKARI